MNKEIEKFKSLMNGDWRHRCKSIIGNRILCRYRGSGPFSFNRPQPATIPNFIIRLSSSPLSSL
ncbi:hypothetical protein DERF_003014 [Dermatophagoides farinae]|uniref:Uncharacterized protein n=1 Tax=Dermatophagoides farinae TaxID=6954 RepID=A0A922ICQ1_DERFA|nr:hypothetical protein DERF_003014 [Dermatophagoides farinae]